MVVAAGAEPDAVFKPRRRPRPPRSRPRRPRSSDSRTSRRAFLSVGGKRHELDERGAVLGRSRECDITLEDPNVSRRHAEVRHENGAWWIVDLGSTNGIEVNGSASTAPS